MPQIQTIEGLHSLSQVQEMSQTFVPASTVDKAAYIAAVEAILKAAEESPDHAVLSPAFRAASADPAPCSRKEDGSVVCRMRQMKLSEIVDAFRRGPDSEYLDLASLRAAPADAFRGDLKARLTFPMLAMIQQQLPTPMMTYALVGVGVIAVLGIGWYLMKRQSPRGASLRGLAGTPSEHAAAAKRYARTAEALLDKPAPDLVGAFQQASYAMAECSWTGTDWPNECVKASYLLDFVLPELRTKRPMLRKDGREILDRRR